jgi:hypothetical protein
MILNSTTDTLEIVLDKTVTSQLNFTTYYAAYTAATVTPSSSHGATNNTASVNLVPAPPSNTQHQLKYCSIFNNGNQDVGTKIRFNDSGSFRNVSYVFLRASESIQYTEESGWRVYNSAGYEKTAGYQKLPPSIRMPEWFGTPTGVALTLISTNSYCIYLGRAERPFSSIRLQYNVSTQAASITWAELAVYKGTPTLQSAATLNRVGFTDVSGVWNSTGLKTTTVTTTDIAIGDDLWAVFSNSAGTATQVTAGSVDHLGAGFMQSITNTRPSTTSSFTATRDSGSAMPWVAWQGVYQGT